MSDPGHVPVLLEPALELLAPRPGETVVDATIGRGGHAVALAEAVGPSGRLVGFDVDPDALERARPRLAATGVPFRLVRANFAAAPRHLADERIAADVVLADLGFSSPQMDDPARGLSFRLDGPLDMRLDPDGPVTAADLLATLDEAELARVIREYGEEPLGAKIARFVVRNRGNQPIHTTAQLAQLVREVYGRRAGASRMHPATRTFMALRIAVNDELGALEGLMDDVGRGARQADGWLGPGARVGVISFHSLEDRIVKRAFADLERQGLAARLTRRPVIADEVERHANPRSRSAKLRVARMATPID
ncbi:MAG: 16S rRNA (cytosine(1402)-N(4))-methyltransferase RsmH [Planctomycetota bacterium]|jgi:16S rRNA (cytosine1402-N4)-methyltransferase